MPGVTVWIAVGNDVCAVCIQSFHVLGLCDVNRSRVIVYRALRRHENGIEVSVHVCAHQLVERSWLPASCPSHRSDGCRMAMPTQRALPRGRFSPARTAQPEGSGRCGCVCAAGRGAGSGRRGCECELCSEERDCALALLRTTDSGLLTVYTIYIFVCILAVYAVSEGCSVWA